MWKVGQWPVGYFPLGFLLRVGSGGGGSTTLKLKHDTNVTYYGPIFEVDEYLRIRHWEADAKLVDVWLKVTAVTPQTGYDEYGVDVLANSNYGAVTIPEGATVVSYGKHGQGNIFLTSDGYMPDGQDAPFIDVFTHQTEDKPWNMTPHARLGKLVGILDLPLAEVDEEGEEIGPHYGLAIGTDLNDTSKPHILMTNQTMSLYGVAMTFINATGDPVGLINPNATGNENALEFGDPADPAFWIKANRQAGISRSLALGDEGSLMFSQSKGVMLFGPYCKLTRTEWNSTRKHSATITGTPRQVAGPAAGTRGIIVQKGIQNLCENPIFGAGTTWWSAGGYTTAARVTDYPYYGTHCIRLSSTQTGVDAPSYKYDLSSPTQSDAYSATVWVRAKDEDSLGKTCKLELREYGGASADAKSFDTVTLTSSWQQLAVSHTIEQSDRDYLQLLATMVSAETAHEFFLDGITFAKEPAPTVDTWGGLQGVTWDGTEFTSKSTSTDTSVELSDHLSIINNQPKLSFRLVARMPRDWDEQGEVIYLMDALNTDDNSKRYLFYVTTDGYLKLHTDQRDLFSVQLGEDITWKAGDWVDFVLTHDFDGNEHRLIVNGDLAASSKLQVDRLDLGAGDWRLADKSSGSNASGLGLWEFAVLYSVLTQNQAAQLYNRRLPFADAGAMETPGLYIFDGNIHIATRFSGERFEMDNEGARLYDSDGDLAARMTVDGMAVYAPTTADPGDIARYNIVKSSGTVVGSLYGYMGLSNTDATIRLEGYAPGGSADVDIRAQVLQSGEDAGVRLMAEILSGADTSIYLTIDKDTGSSYINYDSDRHLMEGGGLILGSQLAAVPEGAIALTDGITEPSTASGYAIIFVDSSNGNLKVKFGDGTVSTIATD